MGLKSSRILARLQLAAAEARGSQLEAADASFPIVPIWESILDAVVWYPEPLLQTALVVAWRRQLITVFLLHLVVVERSRLIDWLHSSPCEAAASPMCAASSHTRPGRALKHPRPY